MNSPHNPKRKPKLVLESNSNLSDSNESKINDRILSVDIDKSKIVKGQMPYVLKLMKMAKEKAFEDGYKLGSKQRGDVHFNLGKKQAIKEISELKRLNKETNRVLKLYSEGHSYEELRNVLGLEEYKLISQRLRNQLRIHWNWLKTKDNYNEVADFIEGHINQIKKRIERKQAISSEEKR